MSRTACVHDTTIALFPAAFHPFPSRREQRWPRICSLVAARRNQEFLEPAANLRERSWNTTAKSITLPLARRQVASYNPVTQVLGERVPRGWVDATLPRTSPVLGIATNTVLKIRREHAQPMVDRAWLARLLRKVRSDSTLLRTARKLGDVDADDLTRDLIRIASRGAQPGTGCLFGNGIVARTRITSPRDLSGVSS